jgi:hypothetical protein
MVILLLITARVVGNHIPFITWLRTDTEQSLNHQPVAVLIAHLD